MIGGEIDWRPIWWLLKKLAIKMKSGPGIQLLLLYWKEFKSPIHKYTNTCMFIDAMFQGVR